MHCRGFGCYRLPHANRRATGSMIDSDSINEPNGLAHPVVKDGSKDSGLLDGSMMSLQADTNTRPKSSRPPRPNRNAIYALPLPLTTYPLPTFVPHNPLSIVPILWTLLKHAISPPPSHPSPRYQGVFSAETGSVHITDPATIQELWAKGFFGKGNLSRSEPAWMEREIRRQAGIGKQTSEETTRKRREERKTFKMERARKERELIEEKLKAEKDAAIKGDNVQDQPGEKTPSTSDTEKRTYSWSVSKGPLKPDHSNPSPSRTSLPFDLVIPNPEPQLNVAEKTNGHVLSPTTKAVRFSPDVEIAEYELPAQAELQKPTPRKVSPLASGATTPSTSGWDPIIKNQEHLQLALTEAFFLSHSLGVLDVYLPSSDTPLRNTSLLRLCRQHSFFPPLQPTPSLPLTFHPDNSFILSYIAYQHYRSLGWVVKDGIKFGADWLLYERGPVFSHAEFAVVIVPAYSHPYWADTKVVRNAEMAGRMSWWWLSGVNRVQTQVRKSLVLCYIEVPPPMVDDRIEISVEKGEDEEVDVVALLGRYRVRDFCVKRWLVNRSRD